MKLRKFQTHANGVFWQFTGPSLFAESPQAPRAAAKVMVGVLIAFMLNVPMIECRRQQRRELYR